MIVGDHIYVMLLVEDFFLKFTNKQLTDSKAATEVIVAISADSKAEVDEMVFKRQLKQAAKRQMTRWTMSICTAGVSRTSTATFGK